MNITYQFWYQKTIAGRAADALPGQKMIPK